MALELYNTLTKRKDRFDPLEPGRVRMYNCGPTVYSYAHIGNFASFLMADVLRRYLEYSGYHVTQVMNITDVGHLTVDDQADAQGEDKLEKKAREEKKDPWEIARYYEEAFHEDRRRLNLLDAHRYPRATDHIPEMIALIEELLAEGLAYQAAGQVYFSIDAFPQYGILSGNTTAELVAGHRVEADPHKKNPLDFTLWKKDPRHLMQWDSPWGKGFPGWHIECSAMSRKYLGEVFDIHTGGEDNIFPHHECEIAQSSGGEGRIFARYWLHRRHILSEGRKMAKSEGNFYTVRDLLDRGFGGLEVRYALISAHYRSQLNFNLDGLRAAAQAVRKLREFRANMESLPERADTGDEVARVERLRRFSDASFRESMDDDLNVSAALASVHTFVSEAYKTCRSRAGGERAAALLLEWDRVLGVLEPVRETDGAAGGVGPDRGPGPSDEAIEALVRERDAARRAKDFATADGLRARLEGMGVVLKDSPAGTRWHRKV
jgi:cysteinyl-tRNA synthetase